MNPQSIKIFLAVYEHGSISAAAKELHFSQPTASEYLGQLEHKVGVKLVLREKGSRKAVLTEAGKAFVPLAKRWMDQQAQLEAMINDFGQTQKKNILRIAASSNGHQYIVSHIACGLMQHFPDIELQLRSVERREITVAITENSFDALFVFGEPIEHEKVSTVPFFYEERCILCPADTRLPERVISLSELDPAYEVYYSKYGGEKDAWHKNNFPNDVKPFFTVSNITSAYNYLTDPRCWTIVPESLALMLSSDKNNRLVLRKIDPAPVPRLCSILVNKDYSQPEIIKKLLYCCSEYIKDVPYLHSLL